MSEETEYEITYSLRRRQPDDDDYTEIAVGSDIQNYCWETERGMPDPDETRADIEGES